MLELIVGGARSGKSLYAERSALENQESALLIATATADDDEMVQRIKQHKLQRNEKIKVIEEPFQLADVLLNSLTENKNIVVDCLTLWVSNLLLKYEADVENSIEYKNFINCLKLITSHPVANIYLVTNEVGMGIIPLGELNRIYCDVVGKLHQTIATNAQRVTLMVAGLPHSIKSEVKK